MSLIDTLKGLVGKGKDVAAQNAEKIESAVDKAGDMIDKKTGGKYSSQIDKGTGAIKGAIPGDQDAPEAAPAPEVVPDPAPAPEAAAEPAPEPPPEATPPADKPPV
ncbi:antitoxin [Nocardia uniformis]|uniref:antitoxin n=1 Tax=Nocardia uniformis TaxID=53432 RepID=UPI0009FFA732|nr:antitoxin [Nocardia uniformis]